MAESMQERCEREVGKARSVSLVAFRLDVSRVKGKVASDKAVKQLSDDLLARVEAWVTALPDKEPHD